MIENDRREGTDNFRGGRGAGPRCEGRDAAPLRRAALAATIATTSLRAFRWRPRGEQGFDPLAIDDGADAPPAGTQLVVLTNNAYSAKVKRLGREDFLASGGDLARWVALALGDG